MERVQQLWVPGLGAQPLDPVQQLPTNALQSQQGTPPTFPRWCLQPGPAGGLRGFQAPHTLLPALSDSVSDSHAAGGPAASEVEGKCVY